LFFVLCSLRIALVYDRINKFGGAERVLTALHRIWPEAPVFTSVYDPQGAPWCRDWDIRTSWLQHIPGARSNHESFGWLMPLAFESLDLSGFEVIISLTSEAAKGVVTRADQLHVCYLLTPTRYLWSHAGDYLAQLPGAIRPLGMAVQSKLRVWDYLAGQRPDYILAISEHVKKRCLKYYRREAEVIYPPMELADSSKHVARGRNQFGHAPRATRHEPTYYLVVSRLVPYKRIDLAIEACNRLKQNLVVVGSGGDEGRLMAMAGPTVVFKGNLTDGELVRYYRGARALLMPQEEDFGLTVVEALSLGTPVVSYKNSGAAEVIEDGKTGVLFDKQTPESLIEAMEQLAEMEVSQTSKKFSEEKFRQTFLKRIEELWENH
jgi:glycosyltransferase involved in cell wall biosynthesis